MADVTLAGLVKKAVSNMSCMTWDLLPGAILALNVVASKATPLSAAFVSLNSCHLGDFSQGSSLGRCPTDHSGGHSGAGGRDC